MTRASTTFRESEVELLDYMMNMLLRGEDPKLAMRHEAFKSLVAKVSSLKASVARQKKAQGQ